jgi:adenosylhomocysteine nucleosidase
MGIVEVATLLVVAAEARELRGIVRRCRRVSRLGWPVAYARAGELNGNRLLLVANGPGPELAARAVAAAFARCRPDAVVSAGYCGALDQALAAGELFVARKVEAGNASFEAAPVAGGRSCRCGTLASVERVASTVAEKRRLRQGGASAVDMEAGAVALEAQRAGLPFYCIRAVLDRAEEEFGLDFNALRGSDGRFSRFRILRAALAKPLQRLPELMRIERRGRLAARALGDFVAECVF